MNVNAQFRRLLVAQVVLGIAAFCIAEQNPGMLLIAGSVAALSWYVTEGPAGRPLPRWLTNFGAVAVLAWLIWRLVVGRHDDLVVAMGHFTMWIQIVLLYRDKGTREEGQLLVLSMVQMIAASTVSVSMIYGALLALYCGLALATVLLFQLKATSDHVHGANQAAAPSHRRVEPPKAVVGRGQRWQLRISGVGIGVICALVAVVVFVVTPRRDVAAQWNGPEGATGRQTVGFSESVRLGGGTGSSGSERVVMNVRLLEDGRPIGGPERPIYVRGAALDDYNTRTHTWMRSFTASRRDRATSITRSERLAEDDGARIDLAEAPEGAAPREAEITLRTGGEESVLFTLYPSPVQLQSEHLDRVVFNAVDQRLAGGTRGSRVVYRLRMPREPLSEARQRYAATLQAGDGRFRRYSYRPPRRADLGRYARGWSVQPQRLRAYADEILEPLGLTRDPDEPRTPVDLHVAGALADHLAGEFSYALSNPPVPRGEDAVIHFLFDQQRGHCELFAAAHAALCRSLGIPARVVTGYLATDYNRLGDYYTVRQRNAHAWTEVYAGAERGWVRFDATPPEPVQRQHQPSSGWFQRMRHLYNHLEFTWLGSVVTYDRASRRQVLEEMQSSVTAAASDEEHLLGQVVTFFRRLPEMWRLERINYTLAGFIMLALTLALAVLVRSIILRRRRMATLQLTALPRTKRRDLARRLNFYIHMLDMLERHGYVRPHWQSPQAFAQELADANPLRFDPVVALTELFYEIRFGYRPLDDDRKQRVRAHLRQLEYALTEARH